MLMRHPEIVSSRAPRRALALATLYCLLLAIAAPLHAQSAQSIAFATLDEAAHDQVWRAYKQRLLEAIETRNRQALLAAIDHAVDNGPDQKRGLEEFERRWSIGDERSPLWRELQRAVQLGGAYVKDDRGRSRFCAPYVAARWPNDYDPFRFGAIVEDGVLVKQAPSSGSRTVARLGLELIAVEDWEVADTTPGFPQKWTRVRLRDGVGFVPEEAIRSPIEHMACFASTGGAWRLVSFTAGYLPD